MIPLSFLAQKSTQVYPEYNYFFSDESPMIWISSEEPQSVSILLRNGRVIFKDSLLNASQKSFLLLPLEKEEFDITGDGAIQVPIRILSNQNLAYDTLNIRILPRKDNAVRIHYLSGLLETAMATQHHFVGSEQRIKFFPFGFYARERDDFEWILRTEAMNGFNLYSPYQAIQDSTIQRRKSYMDLCAKCGCIVTGKHLKIGRAHV